MQQMFILCIQITKQHLSNLEGAVTFLQKTHFLMIRFTVIYLNEVYSYFITTKYKIKRGYQKDNFPL